MASDRTSKTVTDPSGTSSWANAFDAGSRQLTTTVSGPGAGSGTYAYDSFGRTSVLPGIDTNGGADLRLGYYADGQTYSQTQGTTVQTFARDPLDRVSGGTTVTGGQATAVVANHYSGSGDSPSWSSDRVAGTWTRNVTGPGGALAILETGDPGTTKADLQLVDPHGDVVATIPGTANVPAEAMGAITDYDEYGQALTPNPPPTYGWVGAARRSSANQAGLIRMGARMYNPATGRFLTPDPEPGGTPNAYTYPTDPVNGEDLDGTNWLSDKIGSAARWVADTARRAVNWVANKAASVFSGVVRRLSFGRINLHFSFKAPKFRLAGFSAPKIKRASMNWGNLGHMAWGKQAAGAVNVLWGNSKMANGVLAVLGGVAAIDTGVGAPAGAEAIAWGFYQAGSGASKAGKGARQFYRGNANGCMDRCGWDEQAREFFIGVLPFGAFLDEHADALDKLGSLP